MEESYAGTVFFCGYCNDANAQDLLAASSEGCQVLEGRHEGDPIVCRDSTVAYGQYGKWRSSHEAITACRL